MKQQKIAGIALECYLLITIVLLGLAACSNDELVEKEVSAPVVDRVLVKSDDGEWVEPGESRLIRVGEQIKIEGSLLGEPLAVYCNGTHTSTFDEIKDNYLIVTVPDGVKMDDLEEVNANILRVVTMGGKTDYELYYTGRKILVTETDAKRDGQWIFGETKALIGESVRLRGLGFTTDAENISVWINGVQTEPIDNPLDDRITVNIPSYIPFGVAITDESLRNTIRIKTKYDEYIYTDFTIEGRKGEVTRVVLDGENVAIPAASYNDRICIEGKYLATTSAVYCNGVSVNFEQNIDKLILTIPEGLPVGDDVLNPEDKNKIRIVTAYDEPCVYNFIIRPYTPTISGVSNKMPVPGGYFYIEGKYLERKYIDYIRLGEVELAYEEVIGKEGTMLKVYVPADAVCNHGCQLTIISEDLEIVAEQYMCYGEGLFLRTFSKDEQGDVEGGGPMLSSIYHTTEGQLPVSIGTDLPCPEYILSLGNGTTTLPYQTSESNFTIFRFNGANCIKRVIDNSGLAMTPLEDLSIQMEVYMSQPWKSGFLAWRFNKNNSTKKNNSRTYNIIPWTNDEPFVFEDYGWRTITIPFTSFPGMITTSIVTLEDLYGALYVSQWGTRVGMLSVFNYNVEGDNRIYQAMDNFQLNIANIRIVPMK